MSDEELSLVVMKYSSGFLRAALLAGSAIALAGPAFADVKAGVDAWSRGDYKAAVNQWKGPAERGDPDAQFNLAQAYKLGQGVERDMSRAETLYERAAANGHLQAADNYGLLLFQRGERAKAMPFIHAAAGRGDPRAQYVLGLAYFNGDHMPKDWVRAYALVSLAQQAGLAQASGALSQMDEYIPLEQRQQSVPLAAQLSENAATNRASQVAALDLGTTSSLPAPATGTVPAPTVPPAPVASASIKPVAPDSAMVDSAQRAVASAARAAESNTPATAGADYTRPKANSEGVGVPPVARIIDEAKAKPEPKPAPAPVPAKAPATAATATKAPAAATGDWRVQLGAFGVSGNADKLWTRVAGRPELAGHGKLLVPAGRLTKLQAGGFASRAAAEAACARLKSAGFACLPVRD